MAENSYKRTDVSRIMCGAAAWGAAHPCPGLVAIPRPLLGLAVKPFLIFRTDGHL